MIKTMTRALRAVAYLCVVGGSVAILCSIQTAAQSAGPDEVGLRCDIKVGNTSATWHFSINFRNGVYTLRQNGAFFRRQQQVLVAKSPVDGKATSIAFQFGQPVGMYFSAVMDARTSQLSVQSLSGGFTERVGQCFDDRSQGL